MISLKNLKTRLEREKALGEAYTKFFSSPEGKLIMADMMAQAGISRPKKSRTIEESFQWEAVRNFVFSILRKGGIDHKALLEATYTQTLETLKEFPEIPEDRSPKAGATMDKINTPSWEGAPPPRLI